MGRQERERIKIKSEDLKGFLAELAEETSSRAVAVLMAAYLDEMLRQVLEAHFVDDATQADLMFGADRPLGTFSARSNRTCNVRACVCS
jgi:hypothetical protein